MNRILILIGALALAVQAANAQGRDFSGKQLYSDCKALLVVVHGSPTLGEITDAGYCAGFLHGFNSGFASATLKGTDIYCDPAGLSLDTQAQILSGSWTGTRHCSTSLTSLECSLQCGTHFPARSRRND